MAHEFVPDGTRCAECGLPAADRFHEVPISETAAFLELARGLGITVVGIGDVRHPLLQNEDFPHHHHRQVFTPKRTIETRGITRIDAVVLAESAGIYEGCGNGGQAQADTTGLERGVWILLVGGKWGRVA